MKQKMNWSFDEIESRAPWEREVYIQLYIEHIKKEEARMKESGQISRERPLAGPFLLYLVAFVGQSNILAVEGFDLLEI